MISGQELYNALKGATSFAIKAVQEKGRILILGDQGVNRSATLTVTKLNQNLFNISLYLKVKQYLLYTNKVLRHFRQVLCAVIHDLIRAKLKQIPFIPDGSSDARKKLYS